MKLSVEFVLLLAVIVSTTLSPANAGGNNSKESGFSRSLFRSSKRSSMKSYRNSRGFTPDRRTKGVVDAARPQGYTDEENVTVLKAYIRKFQESTTFQESTEPRKRKFEEVLVNHVLSSSTLKTLMLVHSGRRQTCIRVSATQGIREYGGAGLESSMQLSYFILGLGYATSAESRLVCRVDGILYKGTGIASYKFNPKIGVVVRLAVVSLEETFDVLDVNISDDTCLFEKPAS
eukprot:Lankesteria_metandrocarpae@DN8676_c0_g1_i1.p1